MLRVQRIPENSIRDHPAIGQKYVRPELDGDELIVNLDNDPAQPAADAIIILFVVTVHFDAIADFEGVFDTR